jgi:hypothetical protein
MRERPTDFGYRAVHVIAEREQDGPFQAFAKQTAKSMKGMTI